MKKEKKHNDNATLVDVQLIKKKYNIMNKREKQKCYNCAHMEVKDLKRCPKLVCGKWGNALVGAMWCKYYKLVKTDEL